MNHLSPGGFLQSILQRIGLNRYREVFDEAGYAIMLINNSTNRFIKVNRAAAELFGYSEKELRKMSPLELSTDSNEFLLSKPGKSGVPLILPARRIDGRIITIKVQTRILKKYQVSMISDVTEEYRIRHALELNEERLNEAQRIGKFGWWEFRPEVNKYFGSGEIARIFTDEETTLTISYQDNLAFTHPEDRSYLIAGIEEAMEKKLESFSLTYRIITTRGNVKAVHIISNARYDDNGRLLYRFGTCQDITEPRRIMDELITARHQAEESDRLKTTFLANFSHEIRTPLNAMLGFLNILTSLTTTEAEKQEMVKLIELNSQRLLRLINDMIDMSRIETNSMEIKYTNVELNTFIRSMVSSLEHELESAGRKEIKLKPVIDRSTTAVYQYIDELRLSQIFNNLVNNAIKFTDRGEIEYGYRINREENRYTITYFVTDTGQGIRPERLKDIFLPFVQFWNENDPKVQGAGLGLAICKRLSELMKGEIRVVSEPGEGSTFQFSFNTPVMVE